MMTVAAFVVVVDVVVVAVSVSVVAAAVPESAHHTLVEPRLPLLQPPFVDLGWRRQEHVAGDGGEGNSYAHNEDDLYETAVAVIDVAPHAEDAD